jgi:hypothetical protein
MSTKSQRMEANFSTHEDTQVIAALSALARSINVATTYGTHHPAFEQTIENTHANMTQLFSHRKKIHLGAFNGTLSIDQVPVTSSGALIKSLEQRLIRLQITNLRLVRGISGEELRKLAELLACKESKEFSAGIGQSDLRHIKADDIHYEAIHEGQRVANESDLAGVGSGSVLVLEDEGSDQQAMDENSVHVDQIIAFLKGDIDHADADIGAELSEAASDPDHLAKLIMESVAIRQSRTDLSGESLGDIVLGCLRRTFDCLRQQPAFKSSEGVADLRKSLLLLEETILDKMRAFAGEADPELDRQIVQAVREMDENLGFETAAKQYIEQQQAMEKNKEQLQSFIQSKGSAMATELLSDTDFPSSEWRRIVVESQRSARASMADGLNNLVEVFEKIESLAKSDQTDEDRMRDLIGQASHGLDDTLFSTREKLEVLSRQLTEEDTGTIGGQGLSMSRNELLSSISEVAQELIQPLTAINASVEMMLHGYVGSVTDEQHDMLTMAHHSGDHLRFLMDELIAIVGCPMNRGVDGRFHTTSEKVALMNQK